MKQSEYLRELRLNLESKVSPEVLEDILSDYESFFATGREEGKTDDEISDELGSPAFLARSLMEEYADRKQKDTRDVTDFPVVKYAVPGQRLLAWLLDAFIAVLPIFLVTLFILKSFAAPLLLIYYPSPAAGSLVFLGFSAYSTITSDSGVIDTYVNRISDINADAETGASVNINSTNNIDSTDPAAKRIQQDEANKTIPGKETRKWQIAAGIFALAFYLLYSTASTLLLKGQTLGKKIVGIQIRHPNLQLPLTGTILMRELIGKVLLNSIPFIPLISFFTILLTKEHKALHDMLSDTIVTAR